jgi:hypothetical protein
MGGSSYERNNEKNQVTSAFQNVGHVASWYDHTITRCFLPDCPVPRFASSSYTPHLPTPTVASSSLTGSRFRCCCKGWTQDTPTACRCSKPPVVRACVLSHGIPFGRFGLNSDFMSRKPHGGYWPGIPYTCTADPCPGAREHRLLQHTSTRPRARRRGKAMQ